MSDRARDVALFVHGFGSSAACWSTLLPLLARDERIASRYECLTWEYPTTWLELNVLRRIPSLKEVGRALADEIDSPRYANRQLTLVGHSQGGLVILSYMADMLTRGEAWRLQWLRQVVLLATPSEGSNTGFRLRRVAAVLFANPQEIALRTLDPDIAELQAIVRERIVGATRDTGTSWRVPIHSFCGLQDDVVPEASARGPFDNVRRVPGTHFSILRPESHEDRRYSELAEVLLDPGGHAHRHDVEDYDVAVRVEPRRGRIDVKSERQPRVVPFEDYATVQRTVRFAAANRCQDPFTLRYAARTGGFLTGRTSHRNEASAAERRRWEDTGSYFQFDFSPRANESYWLNVEVYGGFGPGQRDLHFHVDRGMRARAMTVTIDLSAYVAAGWRISVPPRLYYHSEDMEHSDLCRSRTGSRPERAASIGEGVVSWHFEEVCTGVVDVVWDVDAPAGAKAEVTLGAVPT